MMMLLNINTKLKSEQFDIIARIKDIENIKTNSQLFFFLLENYKETIELKNKLKKLNVQNNFMKKVS
jgi:hypothetical protein